MRRFAREEGRSVAIRVDLGEVTWAGGVRADQTRPAASLLKVPLAMAAEDALAADPAGWLAKVEVSIGDLLSDWREPTVLRALDPDRSLRVGELIRLAVSSSDGPSAAWLLQSVGIDAVRSTIAGIGCLDTEAGVKDGAPGGALVGLTTADDALKMMEAALDRGAYPIMSAALAASTLNSRIPLGVAQSDVEIAHKTGSLFGVAHDVARLRVTSGEVWLAFLTDTQHDTLVTGYEMGLCTQELLAAFGVKVSATSSLTG